MKKTLRSLALSVISLLLCFSMLLGSTFAWFTDEVESGKNVIQAGNLDIEMHWTKDLSSGTWINAEDDNAEPVFNYDKWEPGYTEVRYVKIKNAGSLSFKYSLSIIPDGEVSKLADVIDVFYVENATANIGGRAELNALGAKGTLRDAINGSIPVNGAIVPTGKTAEGAYSGEVVIAIALKMRESAGNEYQNLSIGDTFSLKLTATQYSFEKDGYGSDYDKDAQWPGNVTVGNSASATVTTTDNKTDTATELLSSDGKISASVPAGALVNSGTDKLTLTVTEVEKSAANITLNENENSLSVDVHIDGIAEDNTTVMAIGIKELLPVGLNMGNYRFYHVEDGATVEMTLLADGATPVHNNYEYDPATGDVVLYLKSFSEIALVADNENAWEGNRDYSWYDASKTELTIANADQLAGFSAIVGGMVGQTQDSFAGKTVKLIADINLGDKESENNPDIIFYPIGYWNNEETYEKTGTDISSGFYTFEGTFDGNGHTVSNFYQNTWEMKGDHDWYSPEEQYYRDGMGLFGRVYGGTVKNLTVKNFSSDGEITTTGVIAAYADGATFENIAIFECNPRVYNIGNGGIVGCVGWYAKEADLKTTFKNITVDNSNKISALWGSYDVACGGIVGQYYPTSGQTSVGTPKNAGISFENCHVSAVMDVYNDVCANYQYYAYRYTGMLIGSVRENVTIDGKSYPKMEGITASGCTVHFGTWNDYYYCEIIDNTTASYTHDYQMSRFTEIMAIDGTTVTYLDGTTGTVPASGRANYVIVDYTKGHGTENATCYHFKDGAVWTHDMGGIQTGIDENGDGQDDLKEDKQHIYLEFNNLVTGYGWGVTTKGVGDLAGVTILDREVGNSVEKFEGKVTELANNKEYKFGDIFNFVDKGVELVPGALSVGVHNLDENNPVSATIVYDRENWENGTITLTGKGKVQITIQDYYFCTPTTITVEITDRQSEEKFDVVMNNGDFLHRVGNSGTVALDKLFKAKDGVTIGTVSVTIDAVNGTSASGEYSNNAIQFNGTGVVKVTITDNDYCIPTELYLEVVDATNLTSATGTTTGGKFVLLCNVNTSTYVNYWNCTLYGNGFTYSLKGAPTAYNSKQGHGVIITKNATLDNLVIVGDIYNSYGAYTNQDYYNTAVDVAGDTTIQNCYVSGCAAPVRVRAGNANIKNTTLYGGSVANLIIDACTTTLENVTTANYDDGSRTLVGMGIVIHSDATESAKLVLNGTLTQYNFVSESKVPTDTYAKNLHNAMFSSDCSQYQFGTSPNRYVNTGIISLTSTFNGEDITDNAKTGYVGKSLSVSSYDGYVYTQPNASGSVNNNYPEYKPTTQGAVPPSYSFDYTNKNYIAKTDGSNDYCYEENGKVNISMDQGDTFNWDTSILTIGKGITNYTVSMNVNDYTGKSIAFNTAGDYEVTYTYIDDNNYKLDENGNITTYSVTYTKTVNITVAVVEAATKHAEFTMGSSNQSTEKITVGNKTYISASGVSHDNEKWSYITVDGTKIFYPIVEAEIVSKKTAYFYVFKEIITITDYANGGTGTSITYNSKTTKMPSGLSVVKGHYNAFSKISNNWSTLTDANLTLSGAANVFKYAGSNAASSTPTTRNNALCFKSPDVTNPRDEYYTIVQYSYLDEAGSTYYYYVGYHMAAKADGGGCFTPDTLITLADGTQKRVDQVTYNDQLLVWNHFTGKYDVAPAAIIFNHGYDNNTIIKLSFSDGTTVKVANLHQFYDIDLNRYVSIDADSVAQYVGHSFAKQSGDGFTTVTLDSYEISVEYEAAYGIISAFHYNIIVEGMLSTDFMLEDYDLFNYFEFGENMVFDEESMKADIEKYGLYTYEDFADYLTYEQFVAFNVQYFKIPVEKGLYTYEGILALIDEYLK